MSSPSARASSVSTDDCLADVGMKRSGPRLRPGIGADDAAIAGMPQ